MMVREVMSLDSHYINSGCRRIIRLRLQSAQNLYAGPVVVPCGIGTGASGREQNERSELAAMI
jgi:hypothetical protein